MADITQVVRTLILADSSVSALVSLRCYPDVLPQEPTLPALTIKCIDQLPNATLGDSGLLMQARIQVSAFDNERVDANALAEAVRVAISKYRGTTSSVHIKEIDLESGEVHGVVKPASGSGRWRYVTSQDFKVFFVAATTSTP